jgi:hypothetical protein
MPSPARSMSSARWRRVHLAHENECGRNLLAIWIRRLIQQVKLGEVKPAQVSEIEWPFGQALACDLREPVAQFGYPPRGDRRPDRHAQLMRHGKLPSEALCSRSVPAACNGSAAG